MGKINIKNFVDIELGLRYHKTELTICNIRDDIINVLKTNVTLPTFIEHCSHEKFDMFIKNYQEQINDKLYVVFNEELSFQDEIKKEIYKRIDVIKKNPENKQLLYLCNKLSRDINVENFGAYVRLLEYCNARRECNTTQNKNEDISELLIKINPLMLN